MVFENFESVLLSTGDFDINGWSGDQLLAQDSDNDYGKILRIDLRTGAASHLTSGHRNPQGLIVDDSGAVWATEHGPRGGDELNLIVEGSNYGWPLETYGTQYGGWRWPPAESQNRHDIHTRPVYAWATTIAVSNLIQVRNFLPEWEGDLLVASLGNKSLHRIRFRESRAIFDETIRIGQRIRDIDQLADGTIVLWTDDAEIVEMRPVATPVPEPIEPQEYELPH